MSCGVVGFSSGVVALAPGSWAVPSGSGLGSRARKSQTPTSAARVRRAPGASSAGAAPQIKVSSSPRRPVESYWWLMAYITINRILGYIFIALLALGAVLGGFAFISQIYQLSDLPVNQYLPALLTLLLMGIGYLLTACVYVVIWFASADFLRAVVEIAENTRRIK